MTNTNTASGAADLTDTVCKAMRRAWQLGQIYWQQADSESFSQQKKSETTYAAFAALLDDTRAALASAAAQPNTIAFMQYYETEEGINGWYLHHPQFYCDIEQQGKNSSEWSIFFRHVNGSEAYSETEAQPGADERRLRRFLCARYEFLPYMDDGEAHGQKLDWLRCTVDQIEARILEVDYERFQASAEPTPATPAPSVLEDAARYLHIRDVPHSDEVRSVLINQQNAVMNEVIDKDRAALAANNGDTHE